jgi:hypothetical protein
MTRDYGLRSNPRAWRPANIAMAAAGLIGILIALAFAADNLMQQKEAKVAEVRYWTVTGPPCPALARAAFVAQVAKPTAAFDFQGVRFARGYGAASCSGPDKDRITAVPVCQFTNPTVLQVTTRKGEFYFMPGFPNRATVSVTDGVPLCVLGSNFR